MYHPEIKHYALPVHCLFADRFNDMFWFCNAIIRQTWLFGSGGRNEPKWKWTNISSVHIFSKTKFITAMSNRTVFNIIVKRPTSVHASLIPMRVFEEWSNGVFLCSFVQIARWRFLIAINMFVVTTISSMNIIFLRWSEMLHFINLNNQWRLYFYYLYLWATGELHLSVASKVCGLGVCGDEMRRSRGNTNPSLGMIALEWTLKSSGSKASGSDVGCDSVDLKLLTIPLDK